MTTFPRVPVRNFTARVIARQCVPVAIPTSDILNKLYEEYPTISQHLLEYSESTDDGVSSDAMQVGTCIPRPAFQKGVANLPNLLIIITIVMSIAASMLQLKECLVL